MATLERLAHQVDVADAFERVVRAALGQFDEVTDEFATDFGGIDEVRQAEFSAIASRSGLKSTPTDLIGADHRAPWIDVQANAAEAEHDDVRARPRPLP